MTGKPTQRDLLVDLIALQTKQSNDIVEIKSCLLGDKYHPEGIVQDTKLNKDCIDNLKRKTIPDLEITFERRAGAIEKSIEKKSGIIGGAVAFVITTGTFILNYLLGKG